VTVLTIVIARYGRPLHQAANVPLAAAGIIGDQRVESRLAWVGGAPLVRRS
jgi:hypothetical protein